MTEKQTLHIADISCGHCLSAIQNELAQIPGVIQTEGDAAQKTITVAFDPPANIAQIKKILSEMHYPASETDAF